MDKHIAVTLRIFARAAAILGESPAQLCNSQHNYLVNGLVFILLVVRLPKFWVIVMRNTYAMNTRPFSTYIYSVQYSLGYIGQ